MAIIPNALQGPARLLLALIVATVATLAFVPAAGAQDPVPPVEPDPAPAPPAEAELSLEVKGVSGGDVRVNRHAVGFATVKPFVPGQTMKIGVYRKGKAVKQKRKTIERKKGADAGIVKLKSPRFVEPAKYSFRAEHEETPEQRAAAKSSKGFGVKYPRLGGKDGGETVKLFHKLLAKQGYGNASNGKDFTDATARAVKAFRKANGMARNFSASPEIFKMVADGKGAPGLKYPKAGRHVEVDISRQIMILADKGKARYTYAVSTGAPGTPSDRGRYTFYRREPGFNRLGMYYSVYYNRGEAIHGYKSVPDYPASHGCIRNAIADARFAYNWVKIGMPIWVYE